MSQTLIWLIVALVLLGAEMVFSTVYLLAFVAGALSACIAALFDVSLTFELILSSAVSVAGIILAYVYRHKIRKLNRDDVKNDLDSGNTVTVEEIEADGSSKVNYRGAIWTAVAANGALEKGVYVIDHVAGNRLVLSSPKNRQI
ncbi:MAG: NfeD family protein [Succinivibrio sp.]